MQVEDQTVFFHFQTKALKFALVYKFIARKFVNFYVILTKTYISRMRMRKNTHDVLNPTNNPHAVILLLILLRFKIVFTP